MTVVDLSWNNILQLRIVFEYYLKDDTEWYIPYGRMILALSVKNHPFFRSPHLYLSSHRIHFQGARSRGVQEIMIISVRKYFLSENLSTSCYVFSDGVRILSHYMRVGHPSESIRLILHKMELSEQDGDNASSPQQWKSNWNTEVLFWRYIKSPTTSSAVQPERRQL